MRYPEFQQTFQQHQIFSINNIKDLLPGFDLNQLYRWQQKDYIIKIRNGLYCFSDFLTIPYSSFLIANLMVPNSYISLESALSYYGIIPEGVTQTTSVSTYNAISYNTSTGIYSYRKIKSNLFFGYRFLPVDINFTGRPTIVRKVLIAEPEKAILDFFYLNPQYNNDQEIYDLRFDNLFMSKELNLKRLEHYQQKTDNESLVKRIRILLKQIQY